MSTNNYSQQDSRRGMMKSTSIISLGTLASRILGFLRDVVLAKMLGTGFKADAFFVALRIPNLLRDMVGEGATNSAMVPVFSEYVEKKDKQELWNFISVVFVLSLMVLSVITIFGMAFAPFIVKMIAPGFIQDPAKLELTIRLTRLMFPYLILIGLTANCMGLLYTFRSFYAPAFSPCLLNIAIIASAYFASRGMKEPVYGLAIGVLVGGLAQLAAQALSLTKKGMRLRIPSTLRHVGAVKIGRLLAPRLVGSAVYELNIFIDTFCASLAFIIGAGGISAIYYANRIIQFPMGVVSFSLASAALPTLSGFAARGEMQDVKKTIVFSLKNTFFVMVPVSILAFLLCEPLIKILFQRGEFNEASTLVTSSALMFYSLGLVSFGAVKILATSFYALQDTRTPVKIAVLCLACNAVLNFVFMGPLKVAGIALASSIAATLNFLCLFFILDKRIGGIREEITAYLRKIFLTILPMALGIVLAWQKLGFIHEIPRLFISSLLGCVIFIATAFVLKVDQIVDSLQWISKRK